MKLLVVSNGFPPRGKWGTEFYTAELVRGLIHRGHPIHVLHPERSGARPRFALEEARADGVDVTLLHNPGDPRKRFAASYQSEEVERAFQEVLAQQRPDLVHFTYLLWGLSVNLPRVAQAAGIPSVITLTDYGMLCHRGQMFDHRLRRCEGPHPPEVCARCIREPSRYDGGWPEVWAKRAVVRTAARVGGLGRVVTARDLVRREAATREALGTARRLIAPTRVLRRAYEAYGAPAERFVDLCYAFDEQPWRRARPAPEGDRHVFAFLGQFTPHKGLGTLLEAVRRMAQRLPESVEPWELRLYGGAAGHRHRRFAHAVLGGDLGPRVRIEPAFEPAEAPEVFARIATIVVPSEWDENAPLTVLQARAAGVPVVASDVAGIREVLEPPAHGALVPPGDPGALADALRTELLAGRRRTADPGLPLGLEEHLDRIEAVHREAAAPS